MRACPVCFSINSRPLFSYRLTQGGEQAILCCDQCGMVFATVAEKVNYATESIYTLPGALGSGESPYDRLRLLGIATRLDFLGIPKDARILDIGCAQGGLLSALRDHGFTNLFGIDPAKACVDATAAKGIPASLGYLGSRHLPESDLTILSHVLEHVEDVSGALKSVPSPKVYIEVPDASRYVEFPIPFLDFNSEHINHFSLSHLTRAVENAGFNVIHSGPRDITLTSGKPYPAIWVVAERRESLSLKVERYIHQSREALEKMNDSLFMQLGSATECVMWGAGEYMTHVASLPVFRRVRIAQVVDRNPTLWGKEACGVVVEPTSQVKDLPIVIATLVAIEAIKRDIVAMGLKNKVVTIL